MIEQTYSGAAPKAQRWQNGYEIPVNITTEEIDDNGETKTRWVYQRVVTPALTTVDIQAVIDRDFNGDNAVYEQAIVEAKAILL